ncbi:MAG: prolyl oligopeptidase family serine peptidase [Verrucomicrobia bacterium]|nr:prolyl oligopeptidase family serine peptidase [Verrucomicrobiota bacterium]
MRVLFIPLLACAVQCGAAETAERLSAKLQSFFTPPAEFAGQLGRYASPLKFHDGRPVASPAEWPARRAEILKYWHGQMGPWPELLARPKLEFLETENRGGISQHRVRIEVAAGAMQHGFLLVPAGHAPRPAVLVPYYVPEVSIAYQGPMEGQAQKMMTEGSRGKDRDFALQLARRGFVTLAIGSPGGDARQRLVSGVRCQPLSYLAYIAANCHTALAQRPEVDPARIGVMGHSYGGKWAMFASCLHEKFACGVWSDGGVVFDEARGNVNYWEPWYLGFDPNAGRKPGLVKPDNPRTGAYQTIFESGRDLHELHALMAPRPFLVSGGAEDFPARWVALNHAVAVNHFLGYKNRVAMTNRPEHSPNAESNEQAFQFLELVLGPVTAATAAAK